MAALKNQVSETYEQLGKVFKALEIAGFEEGKDYGENLTGSFKWFLSPPAALYLQKRFWADWEKLTTNNRLSCKSTPWEGYRELGFDINLIL
jgi:hypothetical protein